MYVITGASGNTGKVIAEQLLSKGKKVRVVGRNADRLRTLADKGAEVFVASLEDTDTLTRAFAGAIAVYTMIPPNASVTENFRGYQNRVADSLAVSIERAGVKHVVSLSSVGADLPDKTGPVKGLYDFEQRLNKLQSVHVLHLRPAYFMENTLTTIGLIKQMGINGGAVRGDLAVPMIATRDIGAYAAKRLLALDYSGKSVQELHGQRNISFNEVTAIIGKTIGQPDLKYVQFSYEDAEHGMVGMGVPKEIAGLYVELSRAINDNLLHFYEPRSAANTTPTSFEEFAPVFSTAFQHS